MSLGLPPFRGAVKWLVIVNSGIYLAELILRAFHLNLIGLLNGIFALTPQQVVHGLGEGSGAWYLHIPAIWQVATYSFLHADLSHVLFNMLALWMFGAMLENDWGARRFLELYFFGVIGGAIATVAMSFAHFLGMRPIDYTVGASAGVYAIIIAFGIVYAEMEITLLLFLILPLTMKAKYLAILTALVVFGAAFTAGGGIATIAHLGGVLCGWLYVKYVPRGGFAFVGSERVYGLRNTFYRWKRKRAQRKFQVYMGKQGRDVPEFDEFGNYIPPAERKPKKDDGSPWVN